MALFNLFRRKAGDIFSQPEKDKIVAAVKDAERQTSGEVRVFVEARCRFVDPLDRAAEIFLNLKMAETEKRNACLVYVAMKDRQLAVLGDAGIHEKVGTAFWNTEVNKMLNQFNKDNYAEGIAVVVRDIGRALTYHFPYDGETDKNELPDEIVFGN